MRTRSSPGQDHAPVRGKPSSFPGTSAPCAPKRLPARSGHCHRLRSWRPELERLRESLPWRPALRVCRRLPGRRRRPLPDRFVWDDDLPPRRVPRTSDSRRGVSRRRIRPTPTLVPTPAGSARPFPQSGRWPRGWPKPHGGGGCVGRCVGTPKTRWPEGTGASS